jgi:hypothetical protein
MSIYEIIVQGILSISIILSIITVIEIIVSRNQQNKNLKSLKKVELKEVLATSNINELGNFLENKIGTFSVFDYISNNEINENVNSYILELTDFVGTESEIEKENIPENKEIIEESMEEEKDYFFDKLPNLYKTNKEFTKIRSDLLLNETWNALARLRRYIEIKLSNIAKKNGIDPRGFGLRKLLSILEYENLIPKGISKELYYSINISNIAIHGKDVSIAQAEEAIYHAVIALNKIDNFKQSNLDEDN